MGRKKPWEWVIISLGQTVHSNPLRGRMTPLGRSQKSPAVSLTSPHGHVGVVRADPPLEGSSLGRGTVYPDSGIRHQSLLVSHELLPSPEGVTCILISCYSPSDTP